jgi:hypothetical protein
MLSDYVNKKYKLKVQVVIQPHLHRQRARKGENSFPEIFRNSTAFDNDLVSDDVVCMSHSRGRNSK